MDHKTIVIRENGGEKPPQYGTQWRVSRVSQTPRFPRKPPNFPNFRAFPGWRRDFLPDNANSPEILTQSRNCRTGFRLIPALRSSISMTNLPPIYAFAYYYIYSLLFLLDLFRWRCLFFKQSPLSDDYKYYFLNCRMIYRCDARLGVFYDRNKSSYRDAMDSTIWYPPDRPTSHIFDESAKCKKGGAFYISLALNPSCVSSYFQYLAGGL